MAESAIPAYITSLIRHFEDLRDGTHGGSSSRKDKEAHFTSEVHLLAPVARQVLTEMNTSLLLDTGQITETGIQRSRRELATRHCRYPHHIRPAHQFGSAAAGPSNPIPKQRNQFGACEPRRLRLVQRIDSRHGSVVNDLHTQRFDVR